MKSYEVIGYARDGAMYCLMCAEEKGCPASETDQKNTDWYITMTVGYV